jgi:PAS domain S-box-containing protein
MPTRHTTEPVHHPIRFLNQVVSALALLLVIYASVFSWQSWQEEKADLIRNLRNIMALEEKAIDTYFSQLEHSMHMLIQDIIGSDDRIDIDHAFDLVKRFKEGRAELSNITFIREDGQILFTAKAPPGPMLPTLAREPSFINFLSELQQGQPCSIGKPLEGLVGKEWIIPIRYAINNKEGRPIYIISANLPVEILQNYWNKAPFTEKAALGLMRDDGFLVSRYPVPDKLEMEKIYGVPRTGTLITYLRQYQFPLEGYVRGPSSLDGPDYLNSFHRLEHFPITLFVAMPMSEIRAGWWNKVKVPYALSVALLIGGFFIYRLTLQWERTREMERFHASEAIRESENRFRNMFERNVAIMLIIDPDTGNIIQANKAALDFYGWSLELLSDMRIQEISVSPSEAVTNEMNKAMSSGSMHLVFQHRRADNSMRDVDVSCCKIEMQGKAFLYSIIHDITERKQAEEKVKELNRDFISLLENASDLIYFVDENCCYRFCSQTVANIAGHASWRDMIGKRALEVFPEEMAKIYYEENVPVFREGKSIQNKVNPFYDTLGNKGWISTNKWPLFDDKGRVISLLGISRDITESKQVQDKLRKSEERLSLVLEATQDGIWDLDLVDDVYYSPRCWQLLGYQKNELNADADLWRRLMHPEDLERVNRVIEDAKANDASFAVEGRFLHKDGHYVPILTRGFIVRDNGGKAIRVSGTSTDLTEQKKIEAERSEWERQRAQIEKAESLHRMADAIGHHCNNQLCAVIHNLELVLDVLPLGSDESERLIDAMKASHRAADVSRQMLTYLEQAPSKLELHDLSEICHKGLLMIQAFIPKNVSMEPVIPFPGPTIRASMGQMQQIFTTLVTNAWESISDNKGNITISVKTVSAADISLSHRFPINWRTEEKLYACLEVADTGSGITNADIDRVFDPFFTTKFIGRGLDLPVVLGVVSAHGGGLTVESEVGRGSIFRVFLPVSDEAVSV